MPISIHSTQSSGQALNALNRSTEALNTSIERISTGRRINRAADDASGLTLADGLNSQARGMGQMIRNLTDSIAMTQVSDAAMGGAVGIVQDIRNAAVQASSAALSVQDRTAVQESVNGSLEALGELYRNTTYNGRPLLSEAPGLAELESMDLTTREGAQAALETIDGVLETMGGIRSQTGSLQNQLASQVSGLRDTLVATQSSLSDIMDVDIAEEAMNMKRAEGLRKAGLFALAQSRTRTETIASLLA